VPIHWGVPIDPHASLDDLIERFPRVVLLLVSDSEQCLQLLLLLILLLDMNGLPLVRLMYYLVFLL